MMASRIERIIDEFPKAELHLHLEGTFEPELLLKIAKRNSVPLGHKSLKEIQASYEFSDLQSFLDIYYAAMSTLLERRDFYELTDAYLQRASEQGVRHAEIFFDPQAHTTRGVEFDVVVSGINDSLAESKRKYGMTSKLIMCFLRDQSAASAEKTLDEALSFKDIICAVGLDSKELGNPPSKFEDVFKRAHREGFIAVAHAGEEAPASYVWETLKTLKVSRIDHGYHSMEDPELVAKLSREQIPLTVCPLASLGVHYFESISNFPLKTMLDAGLMVSVNSDDPAYFGGYIADNYKAAWKGLGLTEEEVLRVIRNSITSSFLDDRSKGTHLAEIDRMRRTLGAES
jgi:adenine deaminase